MSSAKREPGWMEVSLSPRVPAAILRQRGPFISRSAELPRQNSAPGIALRCQHRGTSQHHPDMQQLLVLPGELHVEGRPVHTGDYYRPESDALYGETYTDSGCLFLLLGSQGNSVFLRNLSDLCLIVIE